MKDWKEVIDSGLLELYVLNETTAEQNSTIELLASVHPEIHKEIVAIEVALEKFALSYSIDPDPIIRPFLLATIDYSTRIKSGETIAIAPLLDENSKPEDYGEWLIRDDMRAPADFEDVFAKVMSYTPEAISAIVWVRSMAPQEVHDHEYERFLILEGSCDIYVEQEAFSLIAGDYFQIPLHKKHHVQVTSKFPCKVILQRVAA
ncbi:mannose-6-phosphate isomerase-like protein (cupin superfamily) [Pedobacter sp. UYP24]